ncbi:maleate isomerase [Thalassovita litoralis]|jgi:maleate isomerase|uniref:Maleate isomerase n=1 Tax=Thalassovita litoralis TaxID=1010611 RepID=A0A521E5Q5_9RHOB|nr:aspartate/glutamate racemase family protein [Thalassovita litoralis]SMO78490.1 maleate isomerase [Thalassovita litoralis]
MQITLDNGFGQTARMAVIVLSTDETVENEARLILRDRPVSLLHSRVPAHADVTPETLRLMEDGMPATAALLPAGQDVIGYACTSGATVIGPDRVAALIQSHHPNTPVTNPISAVVAACQALGVTRIAYVSPYVETVTRPMRAFLEQHGIVTITEASFGIKEDWTVARIPEKETENMVLDAISNVDVDAIFTSCTNLRTFGLIDRIEAKTGLSMISSNQALLWHMLKLAGVDARGWGPGKLFQV